MAALKEVLRSLRPAVSDEEYVFARLPAHDAALAAAVLPDALMLFREAEGLTVVLEEGKAGKVLPPGAGACFVSKRITLTLETSLELVGLTAVVATALTEKQIPCNVVAAYAHDHLFVPSARAEEALATIESLSK